MRILQDPGLYVEKFQNMALTYDFDWMLYVIINEDTRIILKIF